LVAIGAAFLAGEYLSRTLTPANQRHLAPQHVDKLRQLVHAGVVEETPHSRLGRCAIPDPADPLNVVDRDPEI
jgi:hypothetical protein